MSAKVSEHDVSLAAVGLLASHRPLFEKMQSFTAKLNRLHDYIYAGKPVDELSPEDRLFVDEMRARKAERDNKSRSPQAQQRQEEAERFLAAVETAECTTGGGSGAEQFRKQVADAASERFKPLVIRYLPLFVVTPWFVLLFIVEQTMRPSRTRTDFSLHGGLSQMLRKHLVQKGLEREETCQQAFTAYMSCLMDRTIS